MIVFIFNFLVMALSEFLAIFMKCIMKLLSKPLTEENRTRQFCNFISLLECFNKAKMHNDC